METGYRGKKVLVMGLGLHGGGFESALFMARSGALVTVTDLRDERVLAPSIEKLEETGLEFNYVLGHHRQEDFCNNDIIIKNPGVRSDSPYLQAARDAGRIIETDIALFLKAIQSRGVTLFAVTGSKGKSSVSSALHWVLSKTGCSYLGGNITVSPLSFVDNLKPGDYVVLELSSWQLGDLPLPSSGEAFLLKPRVAVITPIMPDHLDRYPSMEAYVNDKRRIYREQDAADVTIVADDQWGRSFAAETPARALLYQQIRPGEKLPAFMPQHLRVPGLHQWQNMFAAGLALSDIGLDDECIQKGLADFPGIEHRLEFFYESKNGVKWYNDSAATIPEAAIAAIEAFDGPLVLVAGGSDKKLNFDSLVQTLVRARDKMRGLVLLQGSGTEGFVPALEQAGVLYEGPVASAEAAAGIAAGIARPGDAVVLSPGCASFGMFQNEFDRGRRWKEAVKGL
jgi:UDP-N-acetylmuramoylalanine--D-glutamate ligase